MLRRAKGFGLRLRLWRMQSGLTQTDLASMLNVKQPVITYFELNQKHPTPEMKGKLRVLMELDHDTLHSRAKSLGSKDGKQS
jgi:transcriptional regulator with XRE-family HTH domain